MQTCFKAGFVFQALTSAFLFVWVACLPVRSQAAEAGKIFTKGPYLQAPGQNTMTVMWESMTAGEAIVHFGLNGQTDQSATGKPFKTITANDRQYYLYKVTLNGLKPGSTYAYTVELKGTKSAPKRLRTFAEQPSKVVFIAYGDTRTNPDIHADLAKWFKKYDPDFILHTGDLVARGKNFELWEKEFFVPLANVIDEVPLLAAIGNHEDDGTNYLAQFHFSDQELWYSFNSGSAHFLALDYRSHAQNEPQYQFAEKDLTGNQSAWKIVMLHEPMFNIGGHNSMWGHDAYLPLMHKAKVDLVLGGHSHLYERFKPLSSEADYGKWAITHITTGGGGAPLYQGEQNAVHAAYARTNHFVVIEVTQDSLKGKAVSRDGAVFDEFELKKANGQYDAAYLSGAVKEDKVIEEIKKAPRGTGAKKTTKKSKK